MIILTLKSTGETVVLPTPSGNESPDIDTLPCGKPLTEEQIKKIFEIFRFEISKKRLWKKI
jgi:hypothetical protein